MVYLEDLKYMKLYKKKFYLPINKSNKRKGSAILLLTNSYEDSNKLMNHPLAVNLSKTYQSYYIEKDIMYTINNESRSLEMTHYDYTNIINEQPSVFIETTDMKNYDDLNSSYMDEYFCKINDKVIFFNEFYDKDVLNEAKAYNTLYKNALYSDRIRNNKEMFKLYEKIKTDNEWIKYTYIDYKRYKNNNLFIDLYFYHQAYRNTIRGVTNKYVDMYFEFIKRFINDRRVGNAGYTKRTVFIPLFGWGNTEFLLFDYMKEINPISIFYKKMKYAIADFKAFDNIDFIFFSSNGYFKFNPSNVEKNTHFTFIRLIKALLANEPIVDDEKSNSKDGITAGIIDKLETNRGIKIHNLTGNADSEEEQEELKAELVKKINKAAENSADEEQTLDNMEEDEDIKRIISDLEDSSEDSIKLSASRLNRINKAQDALMNKKIKNTSVKDLINNSNKPAELPETSLPIETITDEWKHLKLVNFEKTYDLDADIVRCLNSLSDTNKETPVSILDIDIKDTSTSEDSIYTYTVKCEGYDGKRFTLKFDIPKFRDYRYMRLRGNEKIFTAELPLIPISKTDPDVVQIASLYNKIFISTYNTSSGKSSPYSSKFIKALSKYDGNKLSIVVGDNTLINNKYELPIDYTDVASSYSYLSFNSKDKNKKITIYFNQETIREKYKIDPIKGIPYAASSSGEVFYYDGKNGKTMVETIIDLIEDEKLIELYNNATEGKKFTYSRATMLTKHIPVIVVMAHGIGLIKAMNIAGIKYTITDKKSKEENTDSIKFADGFINYEVNYSSLLLMNGLKDCDLDDVKISEIDNKSTWINQLDNFGGRDRSDGLDNFKDLMYDPITVEVSRDYDLPDNYYEALAYANGLLADNKFTRQKDLSNNRYRTNEVVAAAFYKVMSQSYGLYSVMNKRGKHVAMSMKQSAVIDLILQSNTTTNLSVFQPLFEIETKNTVSFKGFNGLNSDRAYSLDKRGYDDSMVNIIAQATGQAGTVGINKQMTIDGGIVGGRGYLKKPGKERNVVNTMCMTEALSPLTVEGDDPFRNFMTFTQTSKHSTPIKYSMPLLVTTGADLAMPYLTSDMFCHKAKKTGKVKEVTDKYLLVEYNDGTSEYVNLAEQTMKNSDGGFYITLQLRTDLKPGATVKENTVLAYDNKSFSNRIGDSKRLGYNLGCITKVAIPTTQYGFEDSGICSKFLSEAMSTDIVVCKDINLPPQTNVLDIVKVGQEIREGDPLLIYQNAYDEEDANALLKALNNDDGYVSEIGRNTIHAKCNGVVSDIKIYRTVEKEELSDSLRKIVNKREGEIKKLKAIADKCGNDVQFDSVETLPNVGKLKNVDGVRIEIYQKYHDKLAVGDKCVVNNANKVVLMKIYDDKDAPYTDFRPNEAIDLMSSSRSVDARMITSPIKLGAMYKLMIELSRKVCDIMGVKWKDIHEMYENDKNK